MELSLHAPQNLLAGFEGAASRWRREKEKRCERIGREKGKKGDVKVGEGMKRTEAGVNGR